MVDWADEEAERIWSKTALSSNPFDEIDLIAAALRKAKADGVRLGYDTGLSASCRAVEDISDDAYDAVNALFEKPIDEVLLGMCERVLAARIEKGE